MDYYSVLEMAKNDRREFDRRMKICNDVSENYKPLKEWKRSKEELEKLQGVRK